jgi:Tol biopolymer transport system component
MPDGTGFRKLEPMPGRFAPEWEPEFSPNGQRIAFRGYWGPAEGDYALYVMRSNGSAVKRITKGLAAEPSWSPDGKRIVFDTAEGIGVVSAKGGRARQIVKLGEDGLGSFASPAWSPAGNEIAFTANRHGSASLYTVSPNGAHLTRMPNSVGGEWPSWSPDGKQLVFGRSRNSSHTFYGSIFTISADGSHEREVVPMSDLTEIPSFTSNGTSIAFLSKVQGVFGLYVVRLDGSGLRKVPADINGPDYSWSGSTG